VKLSIKVLPSSSKDCIAGWLSDTLKIKVKAPPEKGKANQSVIKVIENHLNLAKNSIEITSGFTSSKKIINITCDNEGALPEKLEDIHKN
jgi:uncharacterized protein (TIGR00251 family)